MQTHCIFKPLFTGKLVRLAAPAPDDAEHFARWSNDDSYLRMCENDPAKPITAEAYAQWERPFLSAPGSYFFRLRTLDGDRMIGTVVIADVQSVHRTGMMGIVIGEREYRGKGYGSDAIRLILRFAFDELNLYRVWTHTISFNRDAMRAYERAGFRHEGTGRGMIEREGRRFDLVHYGMLREEWNDSGG